MTDMEAIEKNLKEICRRKGLSLTDVANRMATSPSNLLSSVKGNPTVSKIQDIANALQVSVSELLTMRPEKATGIAGMALMVCFLLLLLIPGLLPFHAMETESYVLFIVWALLGLAVFRRLIRKDRSASVSAAWLIPSGVISSPISFSRES